MSLRISSSVLCFTGCSALVGIALAFSACGQAHGDGADLPNAQRPSIVAADTFVHPTSAVVLSGDAGAPSAVELARTQGYLETFYSSADIQHSFLTVSGEQIDCIDFYAQPSVKWFQSQGVPASSLSPTAPSKLPLSPKGASATIGPFDGKPDQNGSARSCTGRTVPITPFKVLTMRNTWPC